MDHVPDAEVHATASRLLTVVKCSQMSVAMAIKMLWAGADLPRRIID